MKLNEVLKPKTKEEIISLMGNLSLNELLLQSSKVGFILGVKEALEKGVDVHIWNDSALQFAVPNGYYNIVKILIKYGANIHVRDDIILRNAAYNGHIDVIELLLDNGADVYARDNDALRFAEANYHYDVIKLLKKWMEKDET